MVKDVEGKIIEVHCTYDPASKGGKSPDGRKVKGTLHWVSAKHAIKSEVRLYDRLFTVENPQADKEKDFKEFINKDSLKVIENAMLEPHLKNVKAGEQLQFERMGYFCVDKDSTTDKLVFNRTVTLRDSWAKVKGK